MMLKPFVSLIFLVLPLMAAAEDFVAGRDYELVSSSPGSNDKAKVNVTEFFSYGCPHCYHIESSLLSWVKKNNKEIQFSRVPVVFNDAWSFYAKAFYTAQELGLGAKLNPLLFQVAQDKAKGTQPTNQTMIDFFTAQGVDPATAKSAFENSTTIDMEVRQGMVLMSRYHINAVPAVVVNNQYKADLQKAKTPDRFFKILDFLVSKARSPSSQTQ